MGLRIGFLGGVPPALGGGGLEVQMHRTASALEALGHEVVRVESAARDAAWDVLHAFGSEGNVHFFLEHWSRTPAPLVISPVLVTSPGRSEAILQLASRWPAPATQAALRRAALRRADRLVALTRYESRVLRRLLGPAAPIIVIPNGVDVVEPGPSGESPPGYALLVGAVSERKRQRDVVMALSGTGPVVVAGAYVGDDREGWDAAIAETGARWLGHVSDAAQMARLMTDAAALVHLSSAEGQSLAVLEALAHGTPAILSDIPSHRELAAAHPSHVRIVHALDELPAALADVRTSRRPATAAQIPTWGDVAAALSRVYADA